jgi:hypothetical protein
MKTEQIDLFPLELKTSNITYFPGQRVFIVANAPSKVLGFAKVFSRCMNRDKFYYVQNAENEVDIVAHEFLRIAD